MGKPLIYYLNVSIYFMINAVNNGLIINLVVLIVIVPSFNKEGQIELVMMLKIMRT